MCSGTFTVVGAERWGCSAARASGTCVNTRTISTSQLEQRVLGALRERLLQPGLVHAFVDEYRRAREQDRAANASETAKLERALVKTNGRIGRLTDMMADGVGDYADMKARLAAALGERTNLERRMEEAEVTPAIALHPNLAEAYPGELVAGTVGLLHPAQDTDQLFVGHMAWIEAIEDRACGALAPFSGTGGDAPGNIDQLAVVESDKRDDRVDPGIYIRFVVPDYGPGELSRTRHLRRPNEVEKNLLDLDILDRREPLAHDRLERRVRQPMDLDLRNADAPPTAHAEPLDKSVEGTLALFHLEAPRITKV
ncbi:hypothetical protein [Sphingomonas sp. LB3N6]|uniref:hypothetical protein n=1 Tax=Sphingomonas fucosidasi TaxID=3096164 RepID=UPI003FA7D8DF